MWKGHNLLLKRKAYYEITAEARDLPSKTCYEFLKANSLPLY